MPGTKPHLIVLNGTSSAGKSSIARELQKNPEIYFLHYQIDMFWEMMPPDFQKKPRYFENRQYAMIDTVRAFLNQGFNIVFDTVTLGQKNVANIREGLKEFSPFIVGVKASLEDINHREKQRGDRDIGLAAEQYPAIHENVEYDFEVNTSELTAAQAAEKILAAYRIRQ